MNNPVSGFHYLLEGFKLMFKPGVKRYVFIPLTINLLLFAALFVVLFHFMGAFNHWFESFLPSWLHFLAWIAWLFFFMSFFLVILYAFVTLTNIIAAPFNSLLSEQVELYLRGTVLESRSLIDNIKDVPRVMGRQLAIIIYYLPRALLILVLFFVPLVQVLAPLLWLLFNAWFLTLTYMDYPTDNHRVSFNQMRDWLTERRGSSLGFGLAVMCATMIPVLNFFTVPAAVAGATKFWVEEDRSSSLLV